MVGRSTLTVSLPTSWIKKVGLKKGDFVAIEVEKDGSLRIIEDSRISRAGMSKICTIKSDLCKSKKILERLIVASYAKGHDTIRIISSDRISSENLQNIRSAELNLMGLSIVEETTSSITLQCSIDPASLPLDLVIRRLYVLYSTMCDEAIQALLTSNIDLAKEAQRREREANMMYALLLRLLNQAQVSPTILKKIGIYNTEDIIYIFYISSALERMADWAFKIAEDVTKIEESGITISKNIEERIDDYNKKIKDNCEMVMKSLFTYDIEMANDAINNFKEKFESKAYEIINELYLKKIFHGIGEIRQIIFALRRIGEISVSIAETVIDRAIEKNKISSVEPTRT